MSKSLVRRNYTHWNKRSCAFLDNYGSGMKVSKAAAEAGFPAALSKSAHTKILFPMMRREGWKIIQRLEKAGMSEEESTRLFLRAIKHEDVVLWPNEVQRGLVRAGMTPEQFGYIIGRDCEATRTKTYKDPKTGQPIVSEYTDNTMSAKMRDMVAKVGGHYAAQKVEIEGQIGHVHAHLFTFDPAKIGRMEEMFDPDKALPSGVEDAEYEEVANP